MSNAELFEEYLEGRSNPEEKLAFEQRMREDAELAREFELYRAMNADMEQWQQTETERESLKQTLQRVTGKQKAKVVPITRYIWRAAAVVIVLMAVWKIIGFTSQKTTTNDLYAQYAGNETFSGSRGGNTDSLRQQASQFLYDKKYDSAIMPLQQLVNTGKDSLHESNLLLGYAYMKINNDSTAERYFTQTPLATRTMKEKAMWFTTLLYLKKGDKKRAAALADSITAYDGEYMLQAKELRKKLR